MNHNSLGLYSLPILMGHDECELDESSLSRMYSQAILTGHHECELDES